MAIDKNSGVPAKSGNYLLFDWVRKIFAKFCMSGAKRRANFTKFAGTADKNLTIHLAQLNFTVGDLAGNFAKICAEHNKARQNKADLVVFSELAISGYPPEDLILRPDFIASVTKMVQKLAALTKNAPAILLGSPWREAGYLYNAAILLNGGEVQYFSGKSNLPNYGVFDEKRVFTPAKLPQAVDFHGTKIGILICEEIWTDAAATSLKNSGAELVICINASPFEDGKYLARMAAARANVSKHNLPLLYLNQIGGQDELLFDGNSFVLSEDGECVCNLAGFTEDSLSVTWQKLSGKWVCKTNKTRIIEEKYASIYNGLKLGLTDYVTKNGFKGVVLGMSGGVDSALTAAVAADALGSSKVRLVMMPSKYTSTTSLKDAQECADLLAVALENVPISSIIDEFTQTLQPIFAGLKSDITEENLQARIRGNILMAISNKFGHMVLTTGNKSEIAVGYTTLYGDMCGGFNILKDIYKTDVFALCRWRNQQSYVIPENIINKAPTAELRPGQIDEDSLPPYYILDQILFKLIELQQSVPDIVASGFVPETVNTIANMVNNAEYKRRQAAPGVKISSLAFGRERRYPIINKFVYI